MKKRYLGKDKLEVSAVGLGIMGMDHAYGPAVDREEMIKLIRRSVELGGNFLDTAPIYGKENEILLGKAIAPIRDKVVIATKFGIFEDKNAKELMAFDSSRESIRKEVESSLKNLNVDYIDLYYQHRPDPKVAPEEVAQTMAELFKEGKIKH